MSTQSPARDFSKIGYIRAEDLFLTESCSRCGGSGSFGPMQVNGARCFGCGGSGRKYKRGNEAKFAAEYLGCARRCQEPAVQELEAGDLVRCYSDPKTAPFSRVVRSYVRWDGRDNTAAVVELESGKEMIFSSYLAGSLDTTQEAVYSRYRQASAWSWNGSMVKGEITQAGILRRIADQKTRKEIEKRIIARLNAKQNACITPAK